MCGTGADGLLAAPALRTQSQTFQREMRADLSWMSTHLGTLPVAQRPTSRRHLAVPRWMNRRYEQVLRSMNRRLVVLQPPCRHRVVPRSLNRRYVLVPRSMNRRLLVLRSRGCCLVALCHLLRSLDVLLRVP